MDTNETLTLSQLGHLSDIMIACERGSQVTIMTDDDASLTGVARHFVKDTESAAFIHNDIDVRDAYVRLSGMFEHYIPVTDMVKALDEGRAFIH